MPTVIHNQLLGWIVRTLGHSSVAIFWLYVLYFFISHMSDSARKFLADAHSDGGTASWSRIAGSVILICEMIWVSFMVYINHAIPDLSGLAILLVAPYGINVIGKTGTMIATSITTANTTTTSNTNGKS
jgi:hypothetical protein